MPKISRAAVSEWLRSWTRNPMGYARTGSNPVRSDFFFCDFQYVIKYLCVKAVNHKSLRRIK